MWKGSRRHQSCSKDSHQLLAERKPLYCHCSALHLKVNCEQLSQPVVNSATLKPFRHFFRVPVRKSFHVLNAGSLSPGLPWGWERRLLHAARTGPGVSSSVPAAQCCSGGSQEEMGFDCQHLPERCLCTGKSWDSLYPRLAEAPPPGLKFPEEPIHSVPSILCEASMAFAWVLC